MRFEIAARRQDWIEAKTFLAPLSRNGRLLEAQQRKRHRAAPVDCGIADGRCGAERTREGDGSGRAGREAGLPIGCPRLSISPKRSPPPDIAAPPCARLKNIGRDPAPQVGRDLPHSGETNPIETYRQIERMCRDNADAPVKPPRAGRSGAGRRYLGRGAVAFDADRPRSGDTRGLSPDGKARTPRGRRRARSAQWLAKRPTIRPMPRGAAAPAMARRTNGCRPARPCGAFATLDWQEGRRKAGLVPFIGTMRETGFGDTVS